MDDHDKKPKTDATGRLDAEFQDEPTARIAADIAREQLEGIPGEKIRIRQAGRQVEARGGRTVARYGFERLAGLFRSLEKIR